MKHLISEIRFEILFWLSMFVTWTMMPVNPVEFIKSTLEGKELIKNVMRMQFNSKSTDEYFDGLAKVYPELKDELEIQKELFKE